MSRTIAAFLCAMLAAALAPPSHAQQERVAELERKLDALTQEIESLKLGAVAETTRYQPRFGQGRAAAKVYGVAPGISVGGYGDMLYENFDREREDDQPSGRLDRIDFVRQVLYVGFKFSDELLFNSEIELEHGGVQDEAAIEGRADPVSGAVEGAAELSGEVVLEFAYLDWALRPALGIRAGMLLVPIGLTNEMHEPPTFLGARRPEVEQRIVPTTWRANGVGIFGDAAGFSYRAYLTEGLDASGFSAADGIRGGRQSGARSLFTRPALTARLDYAGAAGLTLGGALFTGDAWQEFQPPGFDLEPRVTLYDLHGRIEWRGLEARALLARGTLGDAAELSDALGLSGSARLGESFHGGYLEAGWDVLALARGGSRFGLVPYARYERYDTQEGVSGGVENPALDRTVWTLGAAFRPHPNVALKADRQLRANQAKTETSQWNVTLGFLF